VLASTRGGHSRGTTDTGPWVRALDEDDPGMKGEDGLRPPAAHDSGARAKRHSSTSGDRPRRDWWVDDMDWAGRGP